MKLFFLFLIGMISSTETYSENLCFNEAGARFNIDPLLLRSIGIVESNLNPQLIGTNRNQKGEILSKDYGIMQINQYHVPSLIAKGIINNVNDLTTNPCLNIKIGAWLLAGHFQRCGVNWQCLGSYNAGFSDGNGKKRIQYAKKVYRVYYNLNE